MLLPAQMTQRGGICSDSQRITYTPAEGGRRAETLVHASQHRMDAPGNPGKSREEAAPAAGWSRHLPV